MKFPKTVLFYAIYVLVCSCTVFEVSTAAEQEQHQAPMPFDIDNLAVDLQTSEEKTLPDEPCLAPSGCQISETYGLFSLLSCGWQCPELCLCAGYTFGRGVGYPTGYSSIRLLAHSWRTPDQLIQPFLDIRSHILYKGEKAGNIGVGARIYNRDLSAAFGTNMYYDYRRGRHANYSQIGIGVEILGRWCDFRLNGYIPVGIRHGVTSRLFDHYIGNFFVICLHNESSLAGFDAELGCCLYKNPCCPCDFNLYGAVGSYYFSTLCGSDAWGGMLRLEAHWLNCINIEVVTTYDQVFHETIQGIFELCIPLGSGWAFWQNNSCSACSSSCQRDICCQNVRRREIIATGHGCFWHTNYAQISSSCGNCNRR